MKRATFWDESDTVPLRDAQAAFHAAHALLGSDSWELHAVGEVRRKEPRVGLLRLLACVPDSERSAFAACALIAFGRTLDGKRIMSRGEVRGIPTQLHVCHPWQRGAALLWFTGSDAYLAACQHAAGEHGLRLNRKGLWDNRGILVCDVDAEEKVLERIGLELVPPEERRDRQ